MQDIKNIEWYQGPGATGLYRPLCYAKPWLSLKILILANFEEKLKIYFSLTQISIIPGFPSKLSSNVSLTLGKLSFLIFENILWKTNFPFKKIKQFFEVNHRKLASIGKPLCLTSFKRNTHEKIISLGKPLCFTNFDEICWKQTFLMQILVFH